MNLTYFIHQSFFVLHERYLNKAASGLRKIVYRLRGMKIGSGIILPPLQMTWPHQVDIGNNCKLERNIFFKYDGIWKPGPSILIKDRVFIGTGCEFNIDKGISIGEDSLIASGCRFIDHDHGAALNMLMNVQPSVGKQISIGKNVWLGCNVIILKGVEIGDGAIVAAGAVVNKSIPSKEIWGGVPAKKIGDRVVNSLTKIYV